MNARLVLLLLCFLMGVGCASIFGPSDQPLPEGAVEVVPVPSYFAGLWSEVEQCSGLARDRSRVTVWSVDSDTSLVFDGMRRVALYQRRAERMIFIAEVLKADSDFGPYRLHVIRHEMLHALGVEGHPFEYFTEKCGSIVSE